MSYFNDDISEVRLCVLYMLKQINAPITAQLLAAILVEIGLPYFEVRLAIAELEQSRNVASVSLAYGTCYSITPNGEELLSTLYKNLPKSLRQSCDDYIAGNRIDLMKPDQLRACSLKGNNGTYEAVLSSVDKEGVVLSVVINVPDKETCDKLCNNWQNSSHKVYAAILEALNED